MAAFDFRRRRTRRWWYSSVALVAALLVVLYVAGASAILSGSPSKFESNDGNMVVDTSGNHDWANVSYTHVTDPAATTSDDSWVNGQKMDSACAQLATNKNPAKDDFTDVASYNETSADHHLYLYGATIRVAANGNASENVELNQVKGTAACPINRTAGDKLLAFDYLNGGTNLDLHVLTWVSSGACLVSHDTAPCWGATVVHPDSTIFEGEANQSDIAAADNPISSTALAAGRFAEFGVNLTDALGLSPTACSAFAQTDWESRSSGSSFSSNPEDITIEQKTVSNCGRIIIRKVTSPSPDANDTSFSFADTGGLTPTSFTLKNGGSKDFGSSVLAGSYGVSETPNANYTLSNIDCSASTTTGGSSTTIGASGGFDAGDASVSIILKAGDTIDCTFTNTLKTGALVIQKNSTKSGTAVLKTGAKFCYSTSQNCTGTSVTDNGTGDSDTTVGTVCVSGLALGTYYVNETGAPTGYGLVTTGQTNKSATVVSGTNCSTNQPSAQVTFTDPPLADVIIAFRDGGSGETKLVTGQPMTCSADNSTGTDGDTNVTKPTGWAASDAITGVQIGSSVVTVTCTAKIDP